MKAVVISLVKQALVAAGFSITRCRRGAGGVPLDFNDKDIKLFDRVRPYTLTSPARIKILADAVRHLISSGIPGAMAECGVWKGGSMMTVAHTLIDAGSQTRELYLFDVFEGAMPQATAIDVTRDGTRLKDSMVEQDAPYWNFVTEAEVKRNITSTGYPESLVHFIRGPVEQTLPDRAPEQCALIRLDTDLYESTKHELECLYPRLVPGGIVIIDDYGSHQGVKKAVDDFNASLDQRLFFTRVDEAGSIAVKP